MKANSMFQKSLKALAVSSLLVVAGQGAFAGIVGSKHDLTATGGGTFKQSTTAEVCVFCHTPHGANTAALGPLWNKTVAGAGAFTMYSSGTMDGVALTATGSVSGLCLSCHDGATSMDVLINAPGSGLYNAAGAAAGYTWAGGSVTIGAGITQIGTDLTNDHPIAIPYCGGFTAADTCKDPDFKMTALNRSVAGVVTTGPGAGVVNGNLTDQYWLDVAGGTAGKRERTDIILYARAYALGNQPGVECGSCHDPHNTTNGVFLRTSNASSALCTACHSK